MICYALFAESHACNHDEWKIVSKEPDSIINIFDPPMFIAPL